MHYLIGQQCDKLGLMLIKVIHLGPNNIHSPYTLGGEQMGEPVFKKDLDVLLDHALINQCQAAIFKASKIIHNRATSDRVNRLWDR